MQDWYYALICFDENKCHQKAFDFFGSYNSLVKIINLLNASVKVLAQQAKDKSFLINTGISYIWLKFV